MKNENYERGKNDIISGCILSVFAIAYFIMATQIKIMKMLAATFLDASSVPKMWGVLLLILGVVLIIRGMRIVAAEKKAGYVPVKTEFSVKAKEWLGANYAAILMFVVLGLYIWLIPKLGFLICTFLFLWAEFNILVRKEERKVVLTGVLALVFAAAIYALFRYAFNMPLPQGILSGII